jgi:hypothetical protein
MSSNTGPGRPLTAIAMASRTELASSDTSCTRWLNLVIGRVMPMISVSWNASRPIIGRDTWPVIARIGELSMWAVARPVTKFVAPGPDVATHTPTRPQARA